MINLAILIACLLAPFISEAAQIECKRSYAEPISCVYNPKIKTIDCTRGYGRDDISCVYNTSKGKADCETSATGGISCVFDSSKKKTVCSRSLYARNKSCSLNESLSKVECETGYSDRPISCAYNPLTLKNECTRSLVPLSCIFHPVLKKVVCNKEHIAKHISCVYIP